MSEPQWAEEGTCRGKSGNGKLVTHTKIDQISKYIKDNGSLVSHSRTSYKLEREKTRRNPVGLTRIEDNEVNSSFSNRYIHTYIHTYMHIQTYPCVLVHREGLGE